MTPPTTWAINVPFIDVITNWTPLWSLFRPPRPDDPKTSRDEALEHVEIAVSDE